MIGAGPHERTDDAHDAAQRRSRLAALDQGRRCRVADPEAAAGLVLPGGAGAATPHRPGVVRGGHRGVRTRDQHPQGRRPGRGARSRVGDHQERSEPDLRRARCRRWRRSGPVRSPTSSSPRLLLDATYIKGCVDGRVVARAVVVATGITRNGDREVLGCDVGDSETGALWTAFLRSQTCVARSVRSTRDSASPTLTPTAPGWRWCASPPISCAGSSCCACAATRQRRTQNTALAALAPPRPRRATRTTDHRAHPRRLAHRGRGTCRLPPHRAHRLTRPDADAARPHTTT